MKKKLTLVAIFILSLSLISCAKKLGTDEPQADNMGTYSRASLNSGAFSFKLESNQLSFFENGTLKWTIFAKASYIAGLNSENSRVVLVGADNIYVVELVNGEIAADIPYGYEDISSLKRAMESRGVIAGAIYDYLSFRALQFGIMGWAPLAAWYQGWAWFFKYLPF